MPTDILIITIAIVAIFAAFAIVLAWGERQTRGISPHFRPPGK